MSLWPEMIENNGYYHEIPQPRSGTDCNEISSGAAFVQRGV